VVVGVVIAVLVGSAAIAHAMSLTVSSKRLSASAVPVTISTATRTGVADTFTNQATPSTASGGTATTMTVRSQSSSQNQRSFVRFDLSTIPSTARVQTATLQLTMSTAPSASRTYEVDKALASWSAATLTWATMPSAAAATATVASGTTSGVNLTWNVTVDAKAFVASSATNFGWQVKDSTESSATARTATFVTSENATVSQRPTLTVVYAT
jgi:hypothetical protein